MSDPSRHYETIRLILDATRDALPGRSAEINLEAYPEYGPRTPITHAMMRRVSQGDEGKLTPRQHALLRSWRSVTEARRKIRAWMPWADEALEKVYAPGAPERPYERLRVEASREAAREVKERKSFERRKKAGLLGKYELCEPDNSARNLKSRHDFAVDLIANLLKDIELTAETPEKVGSVRARDTEERQAEIYRVYRSCKVGPPALGVEAAVRATCDEYERQGGSLSRTTVYRIREIYER